MVFSANRTDLETVLEAIQPFLRAESLVTEIGCGDGTLSRMIAPLVREVVGIDLDPPAGFLRGDYMKTRIRTADLIIAHGVLHLLEGDVAGKISAELKRGGLLIATLPTHTAANWLRVGIRKLAGVIRGAWLDSLFLFGARILYPSWTVAALGERVQYLYAVPTMYAGDLPGFTCSKIEPWPSTSIAKLDCELRVYIRI